MGGRPGNRPLDPPGLAAPSFFLGRVASAGLHLSRFLALRHRPSRWLAYRKREPPLHPVGRESGRTRHRPWREGLLGKGLRSGGPAPPFALCFPGPGFKEGYFARTSPQSPSYSFVESSEPWLYRLLCPWNSAEILTMVVEAASWVGITTR